MKIIFDKQSILDDLQRVMNSYEDHYQDFGNGEDSDTLTEQEHKERVQKAIDFVSSLTEERIANSVSGMSLKKNGKPRRGAVARLFIGDTGYWFVEWYATYATFRIITKAIDEDTIKVIFENYNLNAGESYRITKI